jgi:shikimate dehydrogenase
MSERAAYQVGLLGSDLGLSLAKVVHEQEARELGIGYRYRVLDVQENPAYGDLPSALVQLKSAGYAGTNITHPFKKSILSELDELSPDAEALGAVNTVIFSDDRSVGHNTDWFGFASSVEIQLAGAAKRNVVQLGAGGAGVAVAHALLRAGVEDLVLLGRDRSRTSDSVEALRRIHPDVAVSGGTLDDMAGHLETADGLVNTTPMGMPAHPGSPVPSALLRPEMWIHDIVYMPLVTQLMRDARSAGCLTLGGEHMFVYQAAENFRLFTGIQPDTGRMLSHLHEIVEARAQAAPATR